MQSNSQSRDLMKWYLLQTTHFHVQQHAIMDRKIFATTARCIVSKITAFYDR